MGGKIAELRPMVFHKTEVFCEIDLNNPVARLMDKISLLQVENWKNNSNNTPVTEQSSGFGRP